MQFLQYIFLIGVISLGFHLIWTYVIGLLLSLIFTILKISKIGVVVTQIIGIYLFVSLISILSFAYYSGSPSAFTFILYYGIGFVLVYFIIGQGIYERHKKAATDEIQIWAAQYDLWLLPIGLLLFIVEVFIPQLAFNPVTHWFYNVIEWLYNIPVIGWIIGLFGILWLIYIGITALFSSALIIGWIIGKIRGTPNE